MTQKQALAYISRYAPCAHENVSTRCGDGSTWAKCEDCGATFLQENWDNARLASKTFDEAVFLLSKLIPEQKPRIKETRIEETWTKRNIPFTIK